MIKKYKKLENIVEAVQFIGSNFSEINDFCGGCVVWKSKSLYWDNENIPDDLTLLIKNKDKNFLKVHIKDYVVKENDNIYVFDSNFNNIFVEI